MAAAPAQSEGDVNSTPLRSAWQREHLDEPSRALLARDSAAFLHQSVSTPCLAPIVRARVCTSRTWPAGATWTSMATTCTTSAMATRR